MNRPAPGLRRRDDPPIPDGFRLSTIVTLFVVTVFVSAIGVIVVFVLQAHLDTAVREGLAAKFNAALTEDPSPEHMKEVVESEGFACRAPAGPGAGLRMECKRDGSRERGLVGTGQRTVRMSSGAPAGPIDAVEVTLFFEYWP